MNPIRKGYNKTNARHIPADTLIELASSGKNKTSSAFAAPLICLDIGCGPWRNSSTFLLGNGQTCELSG